MLPQLATIVSVSSIPIDIEDNAVIMPPGPVSITYTISEVSTKTFFVLEAGQITLWILLQPQKLMIFSNNQMKFALEFLAALLF